MTGSFPFYFMGNTETQDNGQQNKTEPGQLNTLPLCTGIRQGQKKYTLQPVQIPNKRNKNLPRRRNSTAWLPFLLFTDPGRAEPTPHSSQVQLHPHRERKPFRRSRCRDNVYGFHPFVQEESPGPTDRRDTSPRVPRHQHSGTPSVPQKWLNLTP